MFLSLLLCFYYSFAAVLLVPKDGVTPKKIQRQEYAAEADGGVPGAEPDVVLRKPKKERVVQSNSKKKSKSRKAKKEEKSEEVDELEQIYRQEKEFLESKDEGKKAKPRKAASDEESVSSEAVAEPLARDPSSILIEDVHAAVDKAAPLEILKSVEQKYKTASFLKISLLKDVTQELLERTKNYKGDLSLATKGLLKLEINEPQKSMLLVNTKNVWMVDYPIDEAQNKVQILRSDKPEKLKSQGLIALLIGRKSVTDLFDMNEASEAKGKSENNEIVFKLTPKKKDMDIKAVELHVDVDKQLFTQIVYWDELGNKTVYTFTNHAFSAKPPKGFFEFKQPQNSTVTDL